MIKKWMVGVFLLIAFSIFAFADNLEVLVSNPQGELDNLEQLDSIQILFSQKMVDTLKETEKSDKLPDFVTIEPPLEVKVYWSNERLLRIEPQNVFKINKETQFKVTIKKGTKSLDGGVLSSDYVFSFSTPPQKLVRVERYRKNKNARSPYIIALFFNYDIEKEKTAKCLKLSFVPSKYSYPSFFQFQPELENIVKEREPDAEKKYLEKINYLMSRKEREAYFHILDPTNEEVKKFINQSGLNYYIKRYSENKLLLVETDDVAPVESLIQIKFGKAEECSKIQFNDSSAHLFEEDNALFFLRIRENYYDSSEVKTTFKTSDEIFLDFSKRVSDDECFKNLKIFDLTDNKEAIIKRTSDVSSEDDYRHSLKKFGFEPEAGHKYLIRIDENLKSVDGESLGYPAYAVAAITLSDAYVSFGEGEGVWESARGTTVPFYAKNVKTVKQNIIPLNKEEIISTLKRGFSYYDEERGLEKKLEKGEIREIKGLKPDKVFNAGLNLKPYLNEEGKGIVYAEIELDKPIENAPIYNDYYWREKKSIIQVTDLGLTLKYGPTDFIIFVTSLSKAEPVSNCEVEIRDFDNRVVYAGVTNNEGILKVDKKPFSSVDEYSSYYTQEFVVFAKKGNDFAYLVNNWSEGIEPWNFNIPYNWNITQTPQVAGIVFSDRGVYKLQEEVHFKAVLRKKEKGELILFPKGTKAEVKLYDSKGKVKEKKEIELSSLSGIDGVFELQKDYLLGNYRIEVKVGDETISGGFLVAAYRKPEFRVNVDLDRKENKVEAKISSAYLFGSPLSEGKVKYFYEERISYTLPEAFSKKYKWYEWSFFPDYYERERNENRLKRVENEATLDKNGELKLSFDYEGEVYPKVLDFEAEVEDITKQAISNRASLTIYPELFVGIYRGGWSFDSYKDGLKSKILLVDKDGNAVKGKKVQIELKKVVYKSARYSTGYSYYDWESRKDYESIAKKEIISEELPVDIKFDIPSGGEYILSAVVEENGKSCKASEYWWFYGEGYTPWERYTSNKIDLKIEKDSYKVGETAKIMVLSPWEKAKIFVTKERSTVMNYEVKDLTSTQQIIEIPITEKDVPNVFVSVVLIKGRGSDEEQDKPQIRMGYAKISVGKEQKKLNVKIESDKDEYKPAENCKVKVNVKDFYGNNVSGAELTLWAVDVGVLNLTNYKTPDPLERIYKEESLSIFNADSREKLISARVSSPKGEDEGGGGGVEIGNVDQIRKDFRVLAFWVGSALTDAEGNFEGEFKLPESLTAFRIMAVVHTKDNLFGFSEKEFTVSKSMMVNPYFPRFLVVGDNAYARVLLNSRIDKAGKCKVLMESVTPEILSVEGGESEGDVPAKGKREFKFKIKAIKSGKAKIRVSSWGLEEKDAFEVEIPVILPHNGNVRVASGSFEKKGSLNGKIPSEMYPEMGELKIEISNNLLTQFSESYEFVVNYPYGCAEQRSSALTTLLNNYKFAKSVGKLEDRGEKAKKVITDGIKSLEPFQNEDGGFGIWVQDRISYPYLTAYIGKLLVDAKKEGLLDDETILVETIKYLKNISGKTFLKSENLADKEEALALAAKVLSEYGENPDNILTRLSSNLSNLQTITLLHLWDAATTSKKFSLASQIESVLRNRLVLSGDEAFFKERDENERYYYYWYSSDITAAVGLKSFLSNTKDSEIQNRIVRFLVNKEKETDYYFYNTHRNAYVYEALAAYAQNITNSNNRETMVTLKINGNKIGELPLNKKTNLKASKTITMAELLKYAKDNYKIEFESMDNSQISYCAKFKWYPLSLLLEKENKGFKVERKYFDLVTKEEKKTFKTGDLIEVQLEITPTDDAANVAVVDNLPAGFEVLDSAFATTAKKLNEISKSNERNEYEDDDYYYYYGRFNHIEKHDNKVLLFANYLYNKPIKFTYVVRATSEGEFRLQGATVFCMYNEEVRGSSAGSVIKIEKE
jgi:uncharacterized protein YfaS (alpha-2-macroglobulin family)